MLPLAENLVREVRWTFIEGLSLRNSGPTSRHNVSFRDELSTQSRQAMKEGLPILFLLFSLDGLSIVLGLVFHIFLPPGGSPFGPTITLAVAVIAAAEHGLGGFIVGLASTRMKVALIGAAFQPLMDMDHLVIWLDIPVDPRIGHSLFVLGSLILIVWLFGLWKTGPTNFAIFASAQFSIHFAIAPPGFPLLAPIWGHTFRFPSLAPAVVGVALMAMLWGHKWMTDRRKKRRGR